MHTNKSIASLTEELTFECKCVQMQNCVVQHFPMLEESHTCTQGLFLSGILRTERVVYCLQSSTFEDNHVQWCPVQGAVICPYGGPPCGIDSLCRGESPVTMVWQLPLSTKPLAPIPFFPVRFVTSLFHYISYFLQYLDKTLGKARTHLSSWFKGPHLSWWGRKAEDFQPLWWELTTWLPYSLMSQNKKSSGPKQPHITLSACAPVTQLLHLHSTKWRFHNLLKYHLQSRPKYSNIGM